MVYALSDCNAVTKGPYTSLTLKDGAEPMLRIPSSGVARAVSTEEKVGSIEFNGASIPEVSVKFGAPVGLPEQLEADTLYIVSAITVQSCREHGVAVDQLRLVADTVRDAEGKIVGCTALARA